MKTTSFGKVLTTFLFSATLGAAPLKVDFSIPDRPDSEAQGWSQWVVTDGASSKNFGIVSASVRAVHGRLDHHWWKGGAVDGAKMSVDALSVEGADTQIELSLSGLVPGVHTLTTYHNISGGERLRSPGPFSIAVDGKVIAAGVKPSMRAKNDYEAMHVFVRFTAHAKVPVVIRFIADKAKAPEIAEVLLCGFELDGSDPDARATKPLPADGDRHTEAGNGVAILSWTPGKNAIRHRVYLGTDERCVETANEKSPEYRGESAYPSFEAKELSSLTEHFWRVDEVDAQGGVTTGQVWDFQPRHTAFPGAEGYGRFARGGRGGRVIEVTNLNDNGPGSLREAVEAAGPRTVVFAVGGLITLQSKLVMRNPYLTVAGQTAPGKGITLRKYNFGMMGGRDIVVRFVRVRPGDLAGITLDGMGMATSDNCIIDHCSISWTIDESFSSRGAKNITLQRTLISEALNEAGHKNYPPGSHHGYAASIGGMVGSFHHNLLAHNSGRNWSLAGGLDALGRHTGWLDLRNNVVYNWDNRTTDGGAAKVNFVANYYKPGPASQVFHYLKPERNNIQGFGPQDYFVSGNVMEGHVGPEKPWGGVVEPNPAAAASGDRVLDHDDARPKRFESLSSFVKDSPFFEPYVTTQSATHAYKLVLSDVGATAPVLDDHDARVIGETLAGTVSARGSRSRIPGLPDSQADVGGWEEMPEVSREADWDSDHDGMPDWWERCHGLNAKSAVGNFDEANADPDGDGYTNLEDYLAWMAEPHRDCRAGACVEVDLGRLTRGFSDKPVFRVLSSSRGKCELLQDGKTLRFTAESGFAGTAGFGFSVTDSTGDSMTRKVGVRVF